MTKPGSAMDQMLTSAVNKAMPQGSVTLPLTPSKRAIEFYSKVNRNSVGALMNCLNKLSQGPCDLLLIISSDGGSNQWARSAYSSLVNLPPSVSLTTCACGGVDSAALGMFAAGSKRLCHPATRFLLHQASWTLNERVDLRRAIEIAEILKSDDLMASKIISAASTKPLAEIAEMVRVGTVWSVDDALAAGYVHEVTLPMPRLLEGRAVDRIFNMSD